MRIACLLVVGVALCAPQVRAETVKEVEGEGVLARLGTPARAEVVEALLSSLDPRDTDAGVRLAHALGHAGGWGAMPGCIRLFDHRAAEVRLAALEAAGRIGLRGEELAQRVRRTVREGKAQEVRVAVEALGRVGDGRDVQTLLELTESEDTRLRSAAFHALEDLTGASMPFVRARWAWYWKGFRERADRLLPEVLTALADAVEGPDRQALAALVRRYGWIDVPELRPQLADWLLSPDRELRAKSCWLIGELRLADLAPEVHGYLRFAAFQEHRQIAHVALTALGYRVEDDAFSTPGD